MSNRDIGQEILDSIQEIKAGKVGRVTIHMSPEDIKQTRKGLGITQESFAALLNISERTVQEWEQGRRVPKGPAQSLLVIAASRPDVMRELFAA